MTAWWRPAPSGSASTRCSWLPLHAVCTAQTSPVRQSNPRVPAIMSKVASWPVRPRRLARRWVPWSRRLRCGERSRHQRPVRSSTSSARTGSGRIARSAETSSGAVSSAVLVTVASTRSTPCSSSACRISRRMPSGELARVTSVEPSAWQVTSCQRTAPAPPARWPAQPGVPDQPSASPGSTVSGHGTSSALWPTGASVSAGRTAYVLAPPSSAGPQWTTSGSPDPPGRGSSTSAVPADSTWTVVRADRSAWSVTSSLGRAERQARARSVVGARRRSPGSGSRRSSTRRPRGCCR